MSTTWQDILAKGGPSAEDSALLSELGVGQLDEHNAVCLDNVHPRSHVNRDPADLVYDLVALGAGAGGLVSAKQTARRGGKSALVEMHLHGGDCLNVGCVPSKALIRSARAVRAAKRAAGLGVTVGDIKVDFPAIMARMRKLRAQISPADAVSLTEKMGADVYCGRGTFTGPNTLEVGGKVLKFKKAVVATGGSPRVFPIPGLADVPYMTNRTLFNLTELPRRLCVVGAGPIGLEMAQSFALFGSEVTVLDIAPRILIRDDEATAEVLRKSLVEDGCTFHCGIKGLKFSHAAEAKEITASFESADGAAFNVVCDALLVATGRAPNVEGLGLEAAGVKFSPRTGVEVNDLMQTSNPNIYALGDCASMWQFTHMAGTQAQMCVDNAIFGAERKVSELCIPRCTYTTPEVAATGPSEDMLTKDGVELDVYVSRLQHNDRAILEGTGEDEGWFCKILCRKGTGDILGGTIVADGAGEMISEITLAVQNKVTLGSISRTIHPYPTVAECISGCAFQYKIKHWETK